MPMPRPESTNRTAVTRGAPATRAFTSQSKTKSEDGRDGTMLTQRADVERNVGGLDVQRGVGPAQREVDDVSCAGRGRLADLERDARRPLRGRPRQHARSEDGVGAAQRHGERRRRRRAQQHVKGDREIAGEEDRRQHRRQDQPAALAGAQAARRRALSERAAVAVCRGRVSVRRKVNDTGFSPFAARNTESMVILADGGAIQRVPADWPAPTCSDQQDEPNSQSSVFRVGP